MGVGGWGLGNGGLGPSPNPQSPIPNPHFSLVNINKTNNLYYLKNYTNIKIIPINILLIIIRISNFKDSFENIHIFAFDINIPNIDKKEKDQKQAFSRNI